MTIPSDGFRPGPSPPGGDVDELVLATHSWVHRFHRERLHRHGGRRRGRHALSRLCERVLRGEPPEIDS
ncbi:MAG: hypothetical protein M9906_17025 [Microthrixaceae bacterium]|nr:hypothetical protein [Microthrixaceae bacterium]